MAFRIEKLEPLPIGTANGHELHEVKFCDLIGHNIVLTGANGDLPKKSKTYGCISKEFLNILLLGFGFMFSMGSYTTCAMSQTVVLNTVKDEYFQGTETIGYSVLCVVYASVAAGFLIAPSISAIIGPKPAMVLGAGCLLLYVVTFLRPLVVTLYIGALFQGLGQALIWTVYGHFLTENSNKDTLGRNTGVFWCLFQSCLVVGNLFYFVMMQGVTVITEKQRTILFVVLIGSAVVGASILALMRHPWRIKQKPNDALSHGPVTAIVGLCRLAVSKNMLLLFPTFVYVGLELGFFINVYSTCVGYTTRFGLIRESLVGLTGVFIGVGQISGGLLFASVGKILTKHGRDIGVACGFLVHVLAFFLIWLTIPNDASLRITDKKAFFEPNPYIAMICATLLGFGDAAWINQIVALLGTVYPGGSDCLAAFAWWQFLQCFSAAAVFFYSAILQLDVQLLILIIMAVVGLFGYCVLEWRITHEELKKNTNIATRKERIKLIDRKYE
ncbi:UNC93-like protein MFSD11 [Paramacrobiotus metropolitanus]|uniref:UNC93-like protein MFSD11 n=1 Tax=Paramacrobiotus metropolitanus TaxID=2943436 RepID=UPI00244569D6|nr:UNC93-like protein MFSD11 [Paramacrobiotus metropolitanus]